MIHGQRRWGGEVFHVDPAARKCPSGGDWQVLQASFFYSGDFSYDPITASLSESAKVTYEFEEGEEPVSIAVHPSGDDLVYSTSSVGCKLFMVHTREDTIELLAKELHPLQDVGPQKCLAFSFDGSRFATGGVLCSSMSEALKNGVLKNEVLKSLTQTTVICFMKDKVFPVKAELLKPQAEMERHIADLVKQNLQDVSASEFKMFMDFLKSLSLFGKEASSERVQELVEIIEGQADLDAQFDARGFLLFRRRRRSCPGDEFNHCSSALAIEPLNRLIGSRR